MDAKITKKRLSRMLSYDWFKIVLTAAGLIFIWVLIFTTTATRIKNTQDFTIANFMGNIGMSTELSDGLEKAYDDDVFSHEILRVNTTDLATVDENAAYQLLQARTSTGEFDLMFVSTQPYRSTTYVYKETGKEDETRTRSYLESFVGSYLGSLHSFGEGGILDEMAEYLNRYYGGDYTAENAKLDEKLVEEEFRARIKKNKDKRYKKEKQIKKGVQGELERFAKYRTSLLKIHDYLDKGWLKITNSTYMLYNEQTKQMEDLFEGKGEYSLNICPDTMPEEMRIKLSSLIGYFQQDEDGNVISGSRTAKDMQICLFDSNGDSGFRYEGFVYICYLIDSLQA